MDVGSILVGLAGSLEESERPIVKEFVLKIATSANTKLAAKNDTAGLATFADVMTEFIIAGQRQGLRKLDEKI